MKIHPRFKLNGIPYTSYELLERARYWVEEGQPFEKGSGEFLCCWLDSSSNILVQTSGSTGQPKQISLKKGNMVNSARATGEFFKLKPGDTALMCLSAEFIAGKMMLVRAMVLGLALDIVAPDTTPLEKTTHTYDFCAMVPLQAQHSLPELSRIKTLLLGGAPVSSELSKELIRYGSGIFETYGMTETITHIAVRKIAAQGTAGNSSYFRTLPHVEITRDERGCLVIDVPGITEGCIVTNDLVELKDTHLFRWLGRYDNVINSGGVKLIPEQIEAKLSEQLQQRFFVAGVPDAEFGEKSVLFLEGEHDAKQILEDIRMGNSLHKYEIPKAVVNIPKFQETKSGKVDRKAILRSFREG